MTVHTLKCRPEFFRAIAMGVKPFTVRRNDRDFKTGDLVDLLEWDGLGLAYTDDSLQRRISYVLRDFPGIEPGYVVLGLVRL